MAIIEVKYFNTFLIKKIANVVANNPTTPVAPYENIPADYAATPSSDWYVEESRIRGGYNNLTVDFGVKAYLDEENPLQQNRFNSLIYSGIFNSRTGVNDTNQFSVGEDIVKSADPANGSIQKLYAEDTNLIIFQQDKVSRALIDKDAIYSAEGNATITSRPIVIGQIIAYVGEYGISNDPFSFAVYGNRKYFTDKKRGVVLRLSSGAGGGNGITEISSYGMHDFFRDNLAEATNIVGGWDAHNKTYVLSLQGDNIEDGYKTATFDESVLGWTSFFSYKPTYVTSLITDFYSFNNGKIYQHNAINSNYGTFYDITYNSDVTIILNSNPSVVKNFKTLNYEGAMGWELQSMVASSSDVTLPIARFTPPSSTNLNTLSALETNVFANNFKRKENKFFANLINNSSATPGEILFGADSTGVKGFFSTVKIKLQWNTTDSNDINYYTNKKELFSVSSDVVESSY